jgi:large subunit ribosomal protein L1
MAEKTEKTEELKETKEDKKVQENQEAGEVEVEVENKKTISIDEALKELRKDENKRKFIQTVDLIINLHNIDVRKEGLNTFINLPHPSEKKIAAFLNKKSTEIDTITEADFVKFKDAKEIKKLAKKYDYFIAAAPLMGKIATAFGRVLGPTGKMPSPQAGIIPKESDETVKAMIEKMKKVVRVKTKERSIKLAIGKEDLSDSDLKENTEAILSSLEKILPRGKENIKNAMIKFTMTKPIKILDNVK